MCIGTPAPQPSRTRRARMLLLELSASHVTLARSNTLRRHMRKGSGSSPTNKVDSIQASKTGQHPRRSKVKTCFPYQNITQAQGSSHQAPRVTKYSAPTSRCGLQCYTGFQYYVLTFNKQVQAPSARNFSSFHTEHGGPIVHMTRSPGADDAASAGLRHLHADAGALLANAYGFGVLFKCVSRCDAVVRSSLAITEYGISNTQEERPDGGRKMVRLQTAHAHWHTWHGFSRALRCA